MSVVRRGLVIPGDLSGFDIDGDDGTRIQVVAIAASAGGVGRRRIAGAHDVEMRVGIVRTRNPHVAAAVPRGIEVRPGLQTGIALLHRHRVELPLHIAGLGIERLQISGLVEVVAGPDQDVIADDDRRGRGEILQVEIGDVFVPDFLAGLGVQANQNIVGRFHVETVVPHAEPAIADVGAAARLPDVVPDFVAVARIHRPGVVGSRDVNDAVDLQRGTFDIRQRVGFQRPNAADDEIRARAADLASQPRSLLLHAKVRLLTVV